MSLHGVDDLYHAFTGGPTWTEQATTHAARQLGFSGTTAGRIGATADFAAGLPSGAGLVGLFGKGVRGAGAVGKVIAGSGKAVNVTDKVVDAATAGTKLVDKIDEAAYAASRWIERIAERLCFTPDTLVTTDRGQQPLGTVEPGQMVEAFDFASGHWVATEVLRRHDHRYTGTLVAVACGDARIEVTARHPFWVVEGENLADRPAPQHLPSGADEGLTLAGRWIDSDQLRAGDVVVGRDGRRHRIDNVELRQVENLRVCNLTIRDQHTFAVGPYAVLVHNDGWCGILTDSIGSAGRVKLQQMLDVPLRAIHAHHMVQKAIPILSRIPGTAIYYRKQGTIGWYIWQSQQVLKKHGVALLDDMADARKLVWEGKPLHNLTWAFNGGGTHSKETIMAVWRRLSEESSKRGVEEALRQIAEVFGRGRAYTYP